MTAKKSPAAILSSLGKKLLVLDNGNIAPIGTLFGFANKIKLKIYPALCEIAQFNYSGNAKAI